MHFYCKYAHPPSYLRKRVGIFTVEMRGGHIYGDYCTWNSISFFLDSLTSPTLVARVILKRSLTPKSRHIQINTPPAHRYNLLHHPTTNTPPLPEPCPPSCPLLSTPPQTVSSERSTLSPHATHSSFTEAAGKKQQGTKNRWFCLQALIYSC